MLNRVIQNIKLWIGEIRRIHYSLVNRVKTNKLYCDDELVMIGVVEHFDMDDPSYNAVQIRKVFYTTDPKYYRVGVIIPTRYLSKLQELDA